MSLYAIILDQPNETVWKKVRANWPKHFILDERVAYIKAEDALTGGIAQEAGIVADGAAGVVIQLIYFGGRTDGSLVEWMNKNSG